MSTSGKLTLITGPSGVGKGTLVNQLLERHSQIWLSVSATTRSPRQGEQDGQDQQLQAHSRRETGDPPPAVSLPLPSGSRHSATARRRAVGGGSG